jgi:hypothetical protein
VGRFFALQDPLHAIFADYHPPAWCKLCDYAFVVIIAFAM